MKFYTYFTKQGSKVFERFIENGVRKEKLEELEPKLWVKSKTPTDVKTLWGQSLKSCDIPDYKAYQEKKKQFEDIGVDCFGYEPLDCAHISKNYGLECPYNSNQILVFTLDIETEVPNDGFPTPEEAKCRINIITVHHSLNDKYYVFTFKDFQITKELDYLPKDKIVCKTYADERAMLLGFLKFWNDERPDVLTGWNTEGFDLKYLYYRLERLEVVFGRKKGGDALSLIGKTYVNKWGDVELKGLSHLDFLAVMKKFNPGERQWSLNAVAEDFLGVAKISNPYSNFKDFYTKEWDLFVTYNIRDVELVVRLIEKTKQLELVYSLAYLTGCNYEDVKGTLKPWEIYIKNVLMKENVFLSVGEKHPGAEGSIMGGFVKDPLPGKYHWLVSFDQNSLYPSILRSWNVSPETIVSYDALPNELKPFGNKIHTEIPKELPALLKKHKLSMTANGQFFRTGVRGVLPKITGHVYDQRVETKNEMKKLKKAAYEKGIKNDPQVDVLDHKQHALKILLNSLYGALANRFFMFFDFRCAEGITSTGQYIIQRIGDRVGKEIDEAAGVEGSLVYSDTDSVFFSLEALIKKLTGKTELKYSDELVTDIDNFCKGFIAPRVDKQNKEIGEELNAPFNVLAMKREKICESGFWVAKKRYATKLWDDEGLRLTQPKYTITGLEVKRSNTSKLAQNKLMQLIEILLSDEAQKAHDVLENFKKEYFNSEVLDIGLPTGINSIVGEQEYVSATKKPVIPQHVKGALIYNQLLRLVDKKKTYRPIGNGGKVYKYILKPNPITKLFSNATSDKLDVRLKDVKVDAICVPQELEDEEILETFKEFIDKEKMFNLAIGEAALRMIEACGVVSKKGGTLDDFF